MLPPSTPEWPELAGRRSRGRHPHQGHAVARRPAADGGYKTWYTTEKRCPADSGSIVLQIKPR